MLLGLNNLMTEYISTISMQVIHLLFNAMWDERLLLTTTNAMLLLFLPALIRTKLIGVRSPISTCLVIKA